VACLFPLDAGCACGIRLFHAGKAMAKNNGSVMLDGRVSRKCRFAQVRNASFHALMAEDT
jgi:hypothetical protein